MKYLFLIDVLQTSQEIARAVFPWWFTRTLVLGETALFLDL